MKTLGVKLPLVLALSLLFVTSAHAFHVGEGGPGSQPLEKTRLIIKLKPDLKPALSRNGDGLAAMGIPALDHLNISFKVRHQSRLFAKASGLSESDHLRNVFVLEAEPGANLQAMKSAYEELEQVVYAVPDHPVTLYDSPDDSLYEHQWPLNNTGQGHYHILRLAGENNDQLVIEYGTPDADVDWQEVYENYPDNTSAVVVAIVDTGIDVDHPDLADHIWTNPGEVPDDGIDNDRNGFVDDIHGWDFAGDSLHLPSDNDPADSHGHGTHCAGIVTAITDNAKGVAGLVTDCKIMALSFYPYMLTSWAAEAIVYAADNGADVINMSWGLPHQVPVWEDAIAYARARGVIMCAAAGNDGFEWVNYPAGYETTIATAATDDDDHVTEFSTFGNNIDVCAPGLSILSLRAAGTDMYAGHNEPLVHIIDNNYYMASGTSMSSPHLVGAAALLRSVSPGITHERAQEIIQQTADDILDPYGHGDNLVGWDKYSGYGRINLYNALLAAPQVRAIISSPVGNHMYSGTIDVEGSADGADFTGYVLEYGAGRTPSTWTEIANSSSPVTDGILGSWNSEGLTGTFTIRLRVGDYNTSTVTVYAANESVAEISSPSPGDTVVGYGSIIGTAICPDFDRFVVDFGAGSSPSTWGTIHESTAPGYNSELAEWIAGAVPEGVYTVRLTIYSTVGPEGSATVEVFVKSYFAEPNGWTVSLGARSAFIPTYGDFDNDGANEVVIGTAAGLVFLNTDGTPKTSGVPDPPDYDFRVPPVVGDLDGDGIDDLVAVSADPGKLFGFTSSAPPFEVDVELEPEIWQYEYASVYYYPFLLLQDMNNDGKDDIHYCPGRAWSGSGVPHYIYNSDGTPWDCAFPVYTSPGSVHGYVAADIDGDSLSEVYVVRSDRVILKLSSCGDVMDEVQLYDNQGRSLIGYDLSAVDIDGDRDLELILCCKLGNQVANYSNQLIYALNENLEVLPGFPHDTGIPGFYALRHPVFADIDFDGTLEYAANYCDLWFSFVHVWNVDGTPYFGDSGEHGLFAVSPNPAYLGFMTLGNINGDKQLEVVTSQVPAPLSTWELQSIAAWNSSGALLDGWPMIAAIGVPMIRVYPHTPVIGDIDQDGFADLMMTTHLGDLVFTRFPDTDYDAQRFPCTHWRYNRKLNNVFYAFGEGPVICGDANASGSVDVDDAVYLINYIFLDAPAPTPYECGDANCSGSVDIDDVVHLINYVFSGGSAPCDTNGDGEPDC